MPAAIFRFLLGKCKIATRLFGSPVTTFHLGLGIGVIGTFFTYISLLIWDPFPYSIHPFWLLLNQEIGLIVHALC